MASVVCTAGEEPALVLAKYLAEMAWADAGEEVARPAVAQAVAEAGSLLAERRIRELLDLLLTAADTVLPKASPADLECIASLLISFVPSAASPEDVEAAATLLASKLAALNTESGALKLKLLFLLHNAVPPSSAARFSVLLRILQSVGDARQAELLLPNLRRLDLPSQAWWPALQTQQKRELFRALTGVLREHLKGKAAQEAAAFSIKYLALFTAEEAKQHADVREAAAAAALDFLRSPDIFESDLLDVPALHALESDGDAQHALLYQLLTIFLSARLPQLRAFREAHPTALQSLGLGDDESDTKMRLLSLAAAAADSLATASSAAAAAVGGAAAGGASAAAAPAGTPGVGELRYAVLQETLQVQDEWEVESWVVRAVSAGLIDAKMDQKRQTVIVSRASYRVFTSQQWQELRLRLGTWKENVASVSKVAHQARGVAATAPAAAQGATAAVA